MVTRTPSTHTAFQGFTLLASGALPDVALAVKQAIEADPGQPVLIFEEETGQQVDINLQGSAEEVVARLRASAPVEEPSPRTPGRGRPKLGVVAREVTLLPRHWDWLNAQPGGASVTLRRLVEDARRQDRDVGRSARNAAYAFMAAMAGNLPGFEEATRALFANDRARFESLIAPWPRDVRVQATRTAFRS